MKECRKNGFKFKTWRKDLGWNLWKNEEKTQKAGLWFYNVSNFYLWPFVVHLEIVLGLIGLTC